MGGGGRGVGLCLYCTLARFLFLRLFATHSSIRGCPLLSSFFFLVPVVVPVVVVVVVVVVVGWLDSGSNFNMV